MAVSSFRRMVRKFNVPEIHAEGLRSHGKFDAARQSELSSAA
jgi:predicted alternative tryptophan synthase beta-subunit